MTHNNISETVSLSKTQLKVRCLMVKSFLRYCKGRKSKVSLKESQKKMVLLEYEIRPTHVTAPNRAQEKCPGNCWRFV